MSDTTSSKQPVIECQCQAISVPTPTAKPKAIYHCHCIECRRQSSSAFGTSASFPAEPLFPLSPELEAKLSVYTRRTDSGGSMACYFCKVCGSRLWHRSADSDGTSRDTITVKGGCVDGLDWSHGIHIFTKDAVVPIPKNAEQYETMPPGDQ